ncbi:unnamed protein product [marine sediment metagenome]|uniref:Uncharacterized protein n=1 Tax=marine sediment metagenome TaxID=412755 RepID=X1BPN7_9ZZZZ
MSEGEIYTFRLNRRSQTGNTWMNDIRGGSKVADVDIKEVGKFQVRDLRPFLDKSSFKTLAAWWNAIQILSGSRVSGTELNFVECEVNPPWLNVCEGYGLAGSQV